MRIYFNMINSKIKRHFREVLSIIDSISFDVKAIKLSLQSNDDGRSNLKGAVTDSFLSLESEVLSYRKSAVGLEIYFEQFTENLVKEYDAVSSMHSIDPIDLLIEFSRETAMINYDISAESIDCLIIGICESHQISDEQEIEIAEIWANCHPLAVVVSHLISEISKLEYQGETIGAELKNRHFISKLAGKPSPLFSIEQLLESSLN